jgi:hypothetical protein
MAQQQPIFELTLSGSLSGNLEVWVDLGVIPTGKQIFLGYATYISEDKTAQFETRTNNTGQSTGTTVNTALLDWTSMPAGTGVDRDFYQGGNINVLSVVGTGVEHMWLRIKSGSNSSGAYDYIIRYTLQ